MKHLIYLYTVKLIFLVVSNIYKVSSFKTTKLQGEIIQVLQKCHDRNIDNYFSIQYFTKYFNLFHEIFNKSVTLVAYLEMVLNFL